MCVLIVKKIVLPLLFDEYEMALLSHHDLANNVTEISYCLVSFSRKFA